MDDTTATPVSATFDPGGPYEGLLSEHSRGLLVASRISAEVANARGYMQITEKAQLRHAGYGSSQLHVPGLLIPLHHVRGVVHGSQYRPVEPRHGSDGRPIKYETPHRMRMVVDCPKAVRPHLGNPTRPLFVTEGVRKTDSIVTAGFDALALLGVWNWRGRNGHDGLTALPDWEDVAFRSGDGVPRDVYVVYDSDVMLNPSVHEALRRFGAFLTGRGARVGYVYLPAGPDNGKVGADDFIAAGHRVEELFMLAESASRPPAGERTVVKARPDLPPQDGAALLGEVAVFVERYMALPKLDTEDPGYALATVALWVAHTHLLGAFESTPRLAALSAEWGSGKTRLLEAIAPLVPNVMEAVNCTPAALFRAVADQDNRPVILFDEIDTVFGSKALPHEELRGLINAGHRKGKYAYRCVGEGTNQEVRAFPAYAAMALAGLGTLPDTVMSRAIVLRMRRRLPEETVTPFRAREAEPAGHALRDRLAVWADQVCEYAANHIPVMPEEVTDRPADVWEPLLVVADLAGGLWPGLARQACAAFVKAAAAEMAEASVGVQLLRDLRIVFADRPALFTETILANLTNRELFPEALWLEFHHGLPLSARGLARLLRPYGVRPGQVRINLSNRNGYLARDLADAWARYVPSPSPGNPLHGLHPSSEPVPDGLQQGLHVEDAGLRVKDGAEPLTRQVDHVDHSRGREATRPRNQRPGQPCGIEGCDRTDTHPYLRGPLCPEHKPGVVHEKPANSGSRNVNE